MDEHYSAHRIDRRALQARSRSIAYGGLTDLVEDEMSQISEQATMAT